jgi:taurine dioxygenase
MADLDVPRLAAQVSELYPFGAVVDLDAADAGNYSAIEALFTRYSLLVFRNQSLSVHQQRAVMSRLGPISEHWSSGGYVSNSRPGGILGSSELSWHVDNSYTPQPLLGISLHAIRVPYEQTSTRFASGTRALSRLTPALRNQIRQYSILNVLATTDDGRAGRPDIEQCPADCPRAVHPLVVRDPITGEEAVFAEQQHTAAVEGISREAGTALLDDLYQILYADDNIYEHKWRDGDFVIWSNYLVQHARVAFQSDQERTLQRVCISNATADEYDDAINYIVRDAPVNQGNPVSG